MDSVFAANRANWDERTALHLDAYGLEKFKGGMSSLHSIELAEVRDVAGRSLLHLQCHFGMDTLSWARLGAMVTGADFSNAAITAARSLAKELDLTATFLCSDVYELPATLTGQFDIVFTSYGVLAWLPDLARWARVIRDFVKPGGFFYIVEGIS